MTRKRMPTVLWIHIVLMHCFSVGIGFTVGLMQGLSLLLLASGTLSAFFSINSRIDQSTLP